MQFHAFKDGLQRETITEVVRIRWSESNRDHLVWRRAGEPARVGAASKANARRPGSSRLEQAKLAAAVCPRSRSVLP